MAGQWLTCFHQFMVPSLKLTVPRTDFEQRIALFQRPRITTPKDKEIRSRKAVSTTALFHVEQTPVHEPPPWLAAASDEGMAARLEGHHSQSRTQFTKLRDGFAIQPSFPVLSRVAQPCAPRTSRDILPPLGEDLDSIASGTNQTITDPAAETTAISQDVQPLQQAGLAGAVVACDEIDARGWTQANIGQPPYCRDLQAAQPHGGDPQARQQK